MTEAPRCPCCGAPLVGRPDPRALVAGVRLTGAERLIVLCLVERFGQWVSTEQLVLRAFGHRVDGGPEHASNLVSVYLCRARRRLAAVGLRIEGVPYSGRRMMWLDQARAGAPAKPVGRQADADRSALPPKATD